MSDFQVHVSPAERDLLVRLLTAQLREKQIEVHRTEFSREFREHVQMEETQIREMLDKFSHAVEAGPALR
ncbi:MAG: hypothetical protein AB7O59_20140 [Pirellulales bacterium]